MSQINSDDSVKEGSTASRRERNVELGRQKILQAARVLLSQGGLAALSMRKLAGEASLSAHTLCPLWGTREEIVRVLTLDARDRMEASLPKDELLENPIDYCRSLVRASVRQSCRQHEFFRPRMLTWLRSR